MSEKLIKKEQITSFLSLVVVGIALVIAIFVCSDNSFGWFSENPNVDGGGMSVDTRGMPEAEVYFMIDGVRIEENAADLFADLVPGQRVDFQLYVRNKSGEKITVQLFMMAPTAEQDTAVVDDGLFHYFGSQIRLNYIQNEGDDLLTLSEEERYLLPLDKALYTNGLPPTGIGSEYDFSALHNRMLTDAIELDAGEEICLDLELEFVDNNTLQNVYIDFGKEGDQLFARTLLCYLAFAEL